MNWKKKQLQNPVNSIQEYIILKQSLNPLENIFYISLPDELSDSFGDFKLDKNIKLPIETSDIINWNPEQLSWEMIISAMLKILAYDTENDKISYYRDFIKHFRPNIINELTDSGIIKSKDKNYKLAEEIFLAIQGIEPENQRNRLNLAVLYEDKSDSLKTNGYSDEADEYLIVAEQKYKELLNSNSVLSDVYFNAGYFFIKIRKFNFAEECFKSFIEYSNNEEKVSQAKATLSTYKSIIKNESIFNEAYQSILEDNEHKCISLMNTFIDDNPKVWNAWFLLGWAYRRISSFSEAEEALNTALSLNKEEADIFNELAICYMEMGDFNKCQNSLEEALKLTPEDVKIISNMGIVQLKQGNRDKAKNFFETVLALEPEDHIAKQYLETI